MTVPPTTHTTPKREDDAEGEDWTAHRRQITGDEVRVGIGTKSLTLRGSMVISVVVGLSLLGLMGFGIHENMRLHATAESQHRALGITLNRTLRLQTCVLSMTPDERVQWRQSRDAQNALMLFCPGLVVHQE